MRLGYWLVLVLCLGSNCFQENVYANSDIPMLSTKHLSADFWLTKVADADQLLLTETQISARNSDTFARQSEMTELASLADSLTAAALRERIEKASATPRPGE